jgi:diketogulonate reductase-like aldo/keto reductase
VTRGDVLSALAEYAASESKFCPLIMPIEQQITIDGLSVPTFLYGTAWKEESTRLCVKKALETGFRGIDTANQRKHYNEAGVGAALREVYEAGVLTRKDIFLQTKFTHLAGQDQRLPYDENADLHTQVMQSFASSLQHLSTDWIDSFVLHGPSQRRGLAKEDWEVWRAMEDLYNAGKVKILGISNVQIDQLEELCERGNVKPSFVQNRCFARAGWDRKIRKFCEETSIRYQGFSLLTANTHIIAHPQFAKLVSRYRCSPAQLIFGFALQSRMLPLTGTSSPIHMREDLGAYAINLAAYDMQLLESIGEE